MRVRQTLIQCNLGAIYLTNGDSDRRAGHEPSNRAGGNKVHENTKTDETNKHSNGTRQQGEGNGDFGGGDGGTFRGDPCDGLAH